MGFKAAEGNGAGPWAVRVGLFVLFLAAGPGAVLAAPTLEFWASPATIFRGASSTLRPTASPARAPGGASGGT
jgi:hypothetical protein